LFPLRFRLINTSSNDIGYGFKIQALAGHQVAVILALREGNHVFIVTKTHLLRNVFLVRASRLVHPYSVCIQSNRLARAFDFVPRYTKGEEKICVLDSNPWLPKMLRSWTLVLYT